MSTTVNPPRRRLSQRRGSQSALDPFGINAEADTARAAASRITIVRVPQAPPEQSPRHRDRSSWGSTHSNASTGSAGRAPGRLSFAFSSFTPISGPASPGKTGGPALPHSHGSGPPSPTTRRSSSSHSLDRMGLPGGRLPSLTPQQICDLAVSAISHPAPSSPHLDATAPPTPAPFLILPDGQYLPFLERPSEVTALLTSAPTSRLMALLSQTFPADLRAPYDPSAPPKPYGADPARWSFSELMRWLQTTDREEADDREWIAKARTCILARSELIWSRLKAALGVPPELEEDGDDEDEDEDEDYEELGVDGYVDEPEAWLEPILLGDTTTCVASPLLTPDPRFSGRDGGMESIGERAEAEEEGANLPDKDPAQAAQIQGLRLSTPMVEILPRSRPMSPNVPLRRSLSATSAQDSSEARRRDALAMAMSGPGRVRRSAQQERGTGDALFPSSFAKLTMGPSLVANNPALRSGPRRTFRPGVPLPRRTRLSGSHAGGGWDTDGNDYALSVGSESERSFVGR